MQKKKEPIDLILDPISRFIGRQTTSGLFLFGCALTALIASNTPWAEEWHHIWEHTLTIGYDQFLISKDLHHWINDGLMAVFFFVIGLELKREILAGELSNLRDAILPVVAGIGGMVVPALIYLAFNSSGYEAKGWGIPMATDIAFALGILYLLGDRVPLSLKVFLTALAIADDLGAVMVIALFYTSDISLLSLAIGAGFMVVLIGGNLLGIRNVVFYGVVGIGGLWLAFLLSGVHATIAAVLAALTIPANVKIDESAFLKKIGLLTAKFRSIEPNENPMVTHDQLHVLEQYTATVYEAMPPLQRLEHAMHPFVAFVVMPVFALANAGVTFSGEVVEALTSSVTLGVFFGLIVGKFVGIVGLSKLLVSFKLASLPEGVSWRQLYGAALLASVGFTMSLFISELAFADPETILHAKTGILIASFIAGVAGYLVLRGAKGVED